MILIWIKASIIVCLIGLLSACGGDSDDTDFLSSVNGSTSRMVYQNGYLVILNDQNTVSTYDLSDPARPILRDTIYAYSVETLFVEGTNRVFVGASDGSYILQVEDDGTLSQLAFARHTRSCDPVVGDGNYIYVSVRTGTRCGSEREDRLLIYDVNTENDIWLQGVLQLPQPRGLAISGSVLYVCTSKGLQEVDISNPQQPAATNLFPNLICNDLVIEGSNLIVVSDNSITLTLLDQLEAPDSQIIAGQ